MKGEFSAAGWAFYSKLVEARKKGPDAIPKGGDFICKEYNLKEFEMALRTKLRRYDVVFDPDTDEEVDAYYDHKKKEIKLNARRFLNEIDGNFIRLIRVATHEYSRAAGINDDEFQVSSKCLNILGYQESEPPIGRFLHISVNVPSLTLISYYPNKDELKIDPETNRPYFLMPRTEKWEIAVANFFIRGLGISRYVQSIIEVNEFIISVDENRSYDLIDKLGKLKERKMIDYTLEEDDNVFMVGAVNLHELRDMGRFYYHTETSRYKKMPVPMNKIYALKINCYPHLGLPGKKKINSLIQLLKLKGFSLKSKKVKHKRSPEEAWGMSAWADNGVWLSVVRKKSNIRLIKSALRLIAHSDVIYSVYPVMSKDQLDDFDNIKNLHNNKIY